MKNSSSSVGKMQFTFTNASFIKDGSKLVNSNLLFYTSYFKYLPISVCFSFTMVYIPKFVLSNNKQSRKP